MAALKTMKGQPVPDIQSMAALGAWGRNPNHIAEQLTVKYCKAPNLGLPEPYMVEVPVLAKSNADCAVSVCVRQIAMFLPHDWFAWMGSDDLSDEARELVTGFGALADFWEAHDRDDPKLDKNPLCKQRDMVKFLPLVVHGDGGTFQRTDSINVVSMRSLLSAGNVGCSQLLLVALPKACISKSTNLEQDTMHAIWTVLVWSFRALFEGQHPDTDHLGKAWPVASRRRGVQGQTLHPEKNKAFIFALSGDGEWFQNEYKLKGSSMNECCFNCKADKSDIPFNDFRPDAKWRSTTIKHRGTCPTEHLLSKIPGVVGETFAYDSLHILEEGVAAHALGNCFFDFVLKPGWAGTQDAKLRQLFHKVLQQYQELGIDGSNRIARLTLANFCNPKSKFSNFPCLTGLKARQIRYLVPCVLEICRAEEEPTIAYTQHRRACLQHLEEMYQCMDTGLLHFDKDTIRKYQRSTNLCLQHYTKCCKICMGQNFMQWNIVHKHHLAAHMPAQAAFINPKYVTTYTGETMVGFMSSLAHACLNGTPPHLVPQKVCWRFRLALWFRLIGKDFGDPAEEE